MRQTEHGRPGCAASRRLACRLKQQARTPVLLRFAMMLAALFLFAALDARAAEVIPPKPSGYFNEYAGVVSKEAALRFNEQLAQFERETSNQILVVVFRKMESESDIADYTQRIARSWGVGQNDRRNGAVLFVFIDDRKMYIQVNYGLEGVLPDATAFDITARHIKPLFRTGDYEGGLATGIDLILKAIRGEYKGSGETVREGGSRETSPRAILIPLLFFGFMVFLAWRNSKRRGGRGWGYSGMGGPFIGGWSGGSGSGGSSSGGGGFSGFSGGGGGSGGGFGGGGGGSSW